MPSFRSPGVRRAIVAVPFFAAIGLAMRLDRGPLLVPADASRPGFSLTEESAALGVDFVHRIADLDPLIENIEPHVAALGASVSVADCDGDGWMDLYFTSSRFGEPNGLFRNRGDGTFEAIDEGVGVAGMNSRPLGASMGSVWGDFDNDGHEDLLVYRYGKLTLLRNLGGCRFEDVTEQAGLDRWMNSNGAIWFDYDRDGLLDLYVTAYFRDEVDFWNLSTTRIMHNSFEFASNGGVNRLFRNRGDGTFVDVTEETGVGSTRWTMAAAAADFDGDGWPDLYLANDYGPEELFLNREGRRFEAFTAGLESESKSGMNVALGDVFNRGQLDVFVTNISERGYIFQNNNLRMNLMGEGGGFRNIADGVVSDAGWAWGAQFGDLNNDGAQELFVANGFISADPDRSYWYSMSKIAGAHGRMFDDALNWPAFEDMTLSGYTRSRLFLHRGLGAWVDVAERVGVDDLYDGRGVAMADLGNRGALDVIVANQGQPALIYRAQPDSAHNWIGVHLEGTRSNRSAIGAEVVIEASDHMQRQVVDGGMGFSSQNDRRLHFGLGPREWIDRLIIYWPSGERQVVTRPELNRLHTIVEPGR